MQVIHIIRQHLPLLWWYDLDYPRLHAILVDFGDERFKASELIHCLSPQRRVSTSE